MQNRRAKALGILVVWTLLSSAFGYAFGKDYIEPPQWARDVRDEVLEWFASVRGPVESESGEERAQAGSVQLASIFVPLLANWVALPTERKGAGGGVTSFGPDVLVLTFEGRIFAASSTTTLRETSIRPPANGFSALSRAVQSNEYEDYEFKLATVRYNDILHFRSGDLHGLAVSFTEWNADEECYQTSIAVLPLPLSAETIDEVSSTPDDWQPLFSTKPCLPLKERSNAIEGHMAGGRIAFSPPETLYLGSGDYHWDGMHAAGVLAQDLDNDYGKVIAINLRSGENRIVSRGHRNTQGIAVEPNGDVWVVEQGPRGGDELNHVKEGANYGWPKAALGTQYNKSPILGLEAPIGRHDGFEPPVYAWLPSVATSSLTRVTDFHETWNGDLLAGTLKEKSLFRLHVEEGRVVFAEEISVDERIRSVHEHSGGLILWTDSERLMFLEPAPSGDLMSFFADFVETTDLDSIGRQRVHTALSACLECHALEAHDDQGAPPLSAVAGNPIGGTDYPGYSQALQGREGVWSRDALLQYLTDPSGFAPGTTMPNPAISDPRVRGALVEFLYALKDRPGP